MFISKMEKLLPFKIKGEIVMYTFFHDKFQEQIRKALEEKYNRGEIDEIKEMLNNGSLQGMYREVIDSTSVLLEKGLIERMDSMYKEEKFFATDHEKRLENVWRKGFVYLQSIIKISEDCGIEFIDSLNEKDKHDSELISILGVVLKIHAKSIQTAKEVFTLLKAGYPDGAMARWRSLHENTVIFRVLTSKYPDKEETLSIIERYLDYMHIENYKEVRNDKRVSSDTKRALKRKRDEALEKYGKEFAYANMWAKPLVGNVDNIYFHHLEKLAGIDRLNEYYNESNRYVHTSPKGMYESLSFVPEFKQDKYYLFGGSNYGLSIPGQLTGISLMHLTSRLLMFNINLDALIMIEVLSNFSEKCNEAFNDIQKDVKQEIRDS